MEVIWQTYVLILKLSAIQLHADDESRLNSAEYHEHLQSNKIPRFPSSFLRRYRKQIIVLERILYFSGIIITVRRTYSQEHLRIRKILIVGNFQPPR